MRKRLIFVVFSILTIILVSASVLGCDVFVVKDDGSGFTRDPDCKISSLQGEDLNNQIQEIVNQGADGELTADQINSLQPDKVKLLKNKDAILKVKKANDLKPGQVKDAKIGNFKDDQLAVMTSDQLVENINDLDPKRWSVLNGQAVNDAGYKISGVKVTVDIGQTGVGGKFYPGGFEFDKVSSLQIGDTFLTGGSGITYKDGSLQVKSASTFVDGSSIAQLVQNARSGEHSFFVESAKEVRSDCITVRNVSDTTFVDGSSLVMAMQQTHSLIEDCAGNLITAQALSQDSELIISKDIYHPTYVLNNISLDFAMNFEWGTGYENVTSSGVSILNTSRGFGINSIIGSFVQYSYQGENEQSNWLFQSKNDVYRLKLRKQSSDPKDPSCSQCAFFDILDHRIILSGSQDVLKLQNSQWKNVLHQDGYAAQSRFDLDDKNTRLELQHVDQGTLITHVSNYLTISEEPYQAKLTRLFIQTEITPISPSLLSKATSTPTPAPSTIVNSHLSTAVDECTTNGATPSETTELIDSMISWRESS